MSTIYDLEQKIIRIQLSAFRDFKIKYNFRSEGFEDMLANLRHFSAVVKENSGELALVGIRAIQERVKERMERLNFPTPYYVRLFENGSLGPVEQTKESQALAFGWNIVRHIMEQPPIATGPSSAGFGPRSELDREKLTTIRGARALEIASLWGDFAATDDSGTDGKQRRKSRRSVRIDSPFDIVWMIAEFGTGVFADPRTIRESGESKVPGGGGAWYLNPMRPTITHQVYGQEGIHFLFGEREGDMQQRGDMAAAIAAIEARIEQIFERKTRA